MSKWFRFIYQFLKKVENPKPDTLRKAIHYCIDTQINILGIQQGEDVYLLGLPKVKVIDMFEKLIITAVTRKKSTLAKLKTLLYLPKTVRRH